VKSRHGNATEPLCGGKDCGEMCYSQQNTSSGSKSVPVERKQLIPNRLLMVKGCTINWLSCRDLVVGCASASIVRLSTSDGRLCKQGRNRRCAKQFEHRLIRQIFWRHALLGVNETLGFNLDELLLIRVRIALPVAPVHNSNGRKDRCR
jgi:hypothetical protein